MRAADGICLHALPSAPAAVAAQCSAPATGADSRSPQRRNLLCGTKKSSVRKFTRRSHMHVSHPLYHYTAPCSILYHQTSPPTTTIKYNISVNASVTAQREHQALGRAAAHGRRAILQSPRMPGCAVSWRATGSLGVAIQVSGTICSPPACSQDLLIYRCACN